jgi:hypothetical protein
VSVDLVDLAPGSPLRRTTPGGYQTIQAKAHGEDDPATAKPRLSDRAAESTTTQPSTDDVIFDPGGIDVHKKMLAVVVSDVEIESKYQFERRMFGSNPEQLRSLAAWLLEQEVEEVVMESTAQYWETSLGSVRTVLEADP